MPIIETLALTIGGSIAKSLLRIWLPDSTLATTLSDDFIDLIRDESSDLIATRQIARHFEGLGDKIADNLRPIFARYKMEDNSYEAVGREIVAAIEAAHISTKLLVEINFEPKPLIERIHTAYPDASTNFSEVETALYNRGIDLAAQYIIDLVPKLPDYEALVYGEILQRLSVSMGQIEKVLKEIQDVRKLSDESSLNEDREFADFEEDYRRALIRKLDRLELFGVDVARRTRKYPLNLSYVSLTVGSLRHPNQATISVETALARKKYGAIIGEAGSGKSTLLQWLAVRSASNSFEREMIEWAGTLPFLIELRQFPDTPPTPNRFIEKITPELVERMPKQWTHKSLMSGRAIVLVDGLDEVPPANRRLVLDWLEDLIGEYRNLRVVLTSRSAAYNADWPDIFNVFALAPMDRRSIEIFVNKWHEAVLKEREPIDRIRSISDRLLTTLENGSPLLRLASNPLLCAMICALHYDRNMHLPSQRNSVYEACCEMLLERRDTERDIHIAQYPVLSYKQKRLLLDDLAYWMLKNGYASVSTSDAYEQMESRLVYMGLAGSESTSSSILTMLLERSGIIRQPTIGRIDFIHRTFQEYMAATSASSEADWGYLLRQADDDQWQETIVLAMGFANRKHADKLITGLLEKADASVSNKSYLELLAISCLETTTEISPAVRKMVEQRLGSLIPPRNWEEVQALVAARDLAVPYLDYSDLYSGEELSRCIETLGQIGSSEALGKLGVYTQDKRPSVGAAIENVIDYLVPEDISSSGLGLHLLESLSRNRHNSSLRIKGILLYALSGEDPLSWDKYLTHDVSHLIIENLEISDVALFRILPRITSVTITECHAEDLRILTGHKNIRLLKLYCAEPPNLSVLRTLKNLSELCLISYDEESWPDFTQILGLTGLTHLSLFCEMGMNFPELTDIGAASQLEHLHLATMHGRWPDLKPLTNLHNLKTLELSTGSKLTVDMFLELMEMNGLEKLVIKTVGSIDSVMKELDELRMFLPGCRIEIQPRWSRQKWEQLFDD